MAICDTMFRVLKNKGISAYAISKATGIPNSSLSGWKNGKNSPSVDAILAIARCFGLSLDELFGIDKIDHSLIHLIKYDIKKDLSPEQEDKVYKLLEVAMPELIEPEDDDEYIDVYVAARGGNGIQKKKITKKQAERAKKIAEELPDEPTP